MMNLKSSASNIPREIQLYDNIVRAIIKNQNVLTKTLD
jgi:hypothetical protein